ncbi:alanine dehydrogenase [Pacificimonas flava]|uniref:Alanine dehydrogenase n=2 Tax=Pacificimonas TaxID=1960290 RepID=A0A219B733_9SPHN|nr:MULTISPECIES: alanine dehydrogenase [Pacificimonas]MBZ6378530.1 alanine dehydrogenase [Pacificimonas aurantium]OWV34180.1 alanine dehydrogenase [Pacificimonas flava]
MRIGVPKEIKTHEYRVGLTPHSVAQLCRDGHDVIVERDAGLRIDFSDSDYIAAGADIADDAATVFDAAEMVVKVKEPQPEEYGMLSEGQTLFTYLHLAADRQQTEGLIASGATCIAYETVTETGGGLPLLRPMSQVAGRMSVQVGAHFLEIAQGGRGLLLSGVPGVEPARVVILGGGVAGQCAAEMALGMRASVTIFDISATRLGELDAMFGGRIRTRFSTPQAIEDAITEADLVIGAVLVPGARAPHLITRGDLSSMRPGAVLVDIAIDQGGCFETSRPTTHDRQSFIVDDVVHYCVANMPGAVARTSTIALNNVTLPYVRAMAALGIKEALAADSHLAGGVNVDAHRIVHPAVGQTFEDLPSLAA